MLVQPKSTVDCLGAWSNGGIDWSRHEWTVGSPRDEWWGDWPGEEWRVDRPRHEWRVVMLGGEMEIFLQHKKHI